MTDLAFAEEIELVQRRTGKFNLLARLNKLLESDKVDLIAEAAKWAPAIYRDEVVEFMVTYPKSAVCVLRLRDFVHELRSEFEGNIELGELIVSPGPDLPEKLEFYIRIQSDRPQFELARDEIRDFALEGMSPAEVLVFPVVLRRMAGLGT